MVEPSTELIEDLKVVQRCKRDLEAATERAKAARDAAMTAEHEVSEARVAYDTALCRLETSA